MSKILESVSYRIITDDEQSFLDANEKLEAWVAEQPGYNASILSQADDGLMTNLVIWDDQRTAEQAGVKMRERFGESAFMRMIDPASVKMTYTKVLSNR